MNTLEITYAKSAVEPSKVYVGTVEKSTDKNLTLKLANTAKPEYRTLTRAKILATKVVGHV